MSDKVFKGWRSGAGLVFILGVGIALVFYWQIPASAPLWIFYVLIAIIGGLIYGPVMLIGLMAIDMSPTKIAGTARLVSPECLDTCSELRSPPQVLACWSSTLAGT